jgi:hypothetical protein
MPLPLVLRTHGTDDNPAGASPFVDVPQPVGLKDGDLVLVAVATPSAGITVTAPDASWTLITQSDAAATVALAVFWKVALNEPVRWPFALSSSAQGVGLALCYGNADPFQAIESSALARAGGANLTIPSITAAEGGEELVLFLAGGASASWAAVGNGYSLVDAKSQATLEVESYRQAAVAAGARVAFTATYGAADPTAGVAVVLRRGPGALSLTEVNDSLVERLPDGARQFYDLEPGGDYYKFFLAIADTLKVYGFDLVDLLRLEISPATCRYKLPEWERIFGLQLSRTTLLGTIPQRQAQVVSAWRLSAGQGSSIPVVQAILGPVLGYADPTQLQIVEMPYATEEANRTHSNGALIAIVGGGSAVRTVTVGANALVSSAGARLVIDGLSVSSTADYSITLRGPDATTKVWANDPMPFVNSPTTTWLFAPEFAGKACDGTWTVTFSSASHNLSITDLAVVVDDIGRSDGGFDGLGAAQFQWSVVVDHALAGVTQAADFAAAGRALAKISQAHTQATLVFKMSAGQLCAIFDDPYAIFDAAVFC